LLLFTPLLAAFLVDYATYPGTHDKLSSECIIIQTSQYLYIHNFAQPLLASVSASRSMSQSDKLHFILSVFIREVAISRIQLLKHGRTLFTSRDV